MRYLRRFARARQRQRRARRRSRRVKFPTRILVNLFRRRRLKKLLWEEGRADGAERRYRLEPMWQPWPVWTPTWLSNPFPVQIPDDKGEGSETACKMPVGTNPTKMCLMFMFCHVLVIGTRRLTLHTLLLHADSPLKFSTFDDLHSINDRHGHTVWPHMSQARWHDRWTWRCPSELLRSDDNETRREGRPPIGSLRKLAAGCTAGHPGSKEGELSC